MYHKKSYLYFKTLFSRFDAYFKVDEWEITFEFLRNSKKKKYNTVTDKVGKIIT